MDIKYYQIDEVARLTGLTKRAIRYYEDMELFKTERTNASYRLYTDEDVETIKEIKNLRGKLGMNIPQVQRFMGLKKSINEILCGNTKDTAQIKDIEGKIIELQNLVEEREAVLRKIKSNCENYLSKISEIVEHMEEQHNGKK